MQIRFQKYLTEIKLFWFAIYLYYLLYLNKSRNSLCCNFWGRQGISSKFRFSVCHRQQRHISVFIGTDTHKSKIADEQNLFFKQTANKTEPTCYVKDCFAAKGFLSLFTSTCYPVIWRISKICLSGFLSWASGKIFKFNLICSFIYSFFPALNQNKQ